MKNILFLTLFLFSFSPSFCQDIDTLYYDQNMKGLPEKVFASYYRIYAIPGGIYNQKMFRDYYIDGTLFAEGTYISIDKADDSNTSYTGLLKKYFINGEKLLIAHFDNEGILNGEYEEYASNGLLKHKCQYKNGQVVGTDFWFSDDGNLAYQKEYVETETGIIPGETYTITSKEGLSSTYYTKDNSLYQEWPKSTETIQSTDGTWETHDRNNIVVSVKPGIWTYYGKWIKIMVTIVNNSLEPIIFDPEEQAVFMVDKKKQETQKLEYVSAEKYSKSIARKQSLYANLSAISGALSAAASSFNTTTTITSGSYNSSSSFNGRAYGYGSGNSVSGTYLGSSNQSGTFNISETSTTYDQAAAFQKSYINASNSYAALNRANVELKNEVDSYLPVTEILPGEGVSGYMIFRYKNSYGYDINLSINDVIYPFTTY